MKKLTSVLLAAIFAFVGLSLPGCGDESAVVEPATPDTETGDDVLATESQMDQYEAEMKAQSKSR